MADELTVTPNSGAQAPTSQTNLQPTGQTEVSSATTTGRVQPGVLGDQLRSTNGIALTPGQLSTVSLTGTAPAQPVIPADKEFNPALMILSIILFAVAIVLFKVTGNSGKKHNQ